MPGNPRHNRDVSIETDKRACRIQSLRKPAVLALDHQDYAVTIGIVKILVDDYHSDSTISKFKARLVLHQRVIILLRHVRRFTLSFESDT